MINELRKSSKRGLITLGVLQVFDVITTYLALSMGAIEGNPLSDFLLHTHILIPLKVFLILCIALIVWKDPEPTLRGNSVLWWTVGVYSLVVVLNLIHILALIV